MSELLRSPKLRPWHLDRVAVVYVRQSTPQQVLDHKESTARQYALADRAVALGWPRDRVATIDDDLGKSGQSIEGRPGFQRLLAEVAPDRVGLILGLEMSRLARSCKDWHQLLELCGRYRVLLADADGVFDPTDHSDRLLLGLHGVMNEAELHVLKQRMYLGKLNKAKRGELFSGQPIGYIRSATGAWAIDPDEEVRAVVRLVFDQFDREATMHGLLRYLVHHQVRIPVRVAGGPNKGQLEWHRPNRASLQNLLRNPTYAGAYRYGRRPTDPRAKHPGRPGTGKRGSAAPRSAWCSSATACRRTSRGTGSRRIRPAWPRTGARRRRRVPRGTGRHCWPGWSAAGGAGNAWWSGTAVGAAGRTRTRACARRPTTASRCARCCRTGPRWTPWSPARCWRRSSRRPWRPAWRRSPGWSGSGPN